MIKLSNKVVILGGGTGGIATAARLKKYISAQEITIVEPASEHFYQPLWTLAGAGVVKKENSKKPMSELIPRGANWLKEKVIQVLPQENKIILSNNIELNYEYLVVATGLQIRWESVEGLPQTLGKNGVISIYDYSTLEATFDTIKNFQGGDAIFVMPPVPIKCAGAPQKIMYLAEEIFREQGVRHKSQVYFVTAGKAMFGIPTFAEALENVRKRKNIEPLFQHKLIAIDAIKKEAKFIVTDADGKSSVKIVKYDLLHVVPTMMAHDYVAESGLAFANGEHKGWLEVDKHSLQHLKFSNIFGIGDVTGIPNSKTGAAIRMQYPIVVDNLLSVMAGNKPSRHYDGYSSCPLITEKGKVMLAEFGYDGKLMPTFPLDPTIERRSMWILKKDILPLLYWYGMMKGLA